LPKGRQIAGLLVLAALVTFEEAAYAQRTAARVRRRFEPTDLDLRGAGAAEIDLQGGPVAGATSSRVVAPDMEATLGLSPNAQFQLDGAMGFDDSHGPTFRFLENVWTSIKLGMFDRNDETGVAWAGGVQAGPKLPTITSSHGIGLEALAIVGRSNERLRVFGQAGVMLDPFVSVPNAPDVRPFAAEGGFDLELDLDARGLWSLKSELGAAHFWSLGTTEVHLTAGLAYQFLPSLELSAIGVGGLGPGDRVGFLFGAAQRFSVF
jgi:hypothetical protein